MPMYEDATNASNVIHVSDEAKNSLVFGTEKVLERIAEAVVGVPGESARVSLETWYGIPPERIAEDIGRVLEGKGRRVRIVDTRSLFQSPEEIATYKKRFLTDDPAFGFANREGRMTDIMDLGAIEALKVQLDGAKGEAVIVCGPGAMAGGLSNHYDVRCFFDITREPLLWKMWRGELVPFGAAEPGKDYSWKEYYYCDFYLLHFQKKDVLERMDFYIETIEYDKMKLVPRRAYDEILSTLVHYPVKQVKAFQPGPWGAYRYRDLFHVPGLECNAWNRLASAECSISIDVGREEQLSVALPNLMQYNREMCGDFLSKRYPDLFPLEIWLDDGYFPTPQPAERISMPIHNHPDSAYVARHFNEPLGRYETYHIVEAYEGANTWMGFKDDVDLEKWEEACWKSKNLVPIEDWKDFIANHRSNVGDLYLIPPGTVHGHGGNQMVLEMDTCPSIAGTEYSFFEYDFARHSWDDEKKTMTGKPMKMHLEHAFDNERWRRESYVKGQQRARAEIVSWNGDFSLEKYSTLPEMPFDVERFHFTRRAESSTRGQEPCILTLTIGTKVRIVSKKHPSIGTTLDRLQSAILPACFGEYEILTEDPGYCVIVKFSWKALQ